MSQELSGEQKADLECLSKELFGMDLAKRVAGHLRKNGAIAYNHRDYCGTGLFFQGGQYMHTFVDDGHPVVYRAQEKGWAFHDVYKFIGWLAEQSDYSLSMYDNPGVFNNQTITRKRLEDALSKETM